VKCLNLDPFAVTFDFRLRDEGIHECFDGITGIMFFVKTKTNRRTMILQKSSQSGGLPFERTMATRAGASITHGPWQRVLHLNKKLGNVES
jgi:hypothetical protein